MVPIGPACARIPPGPLTPTARRGSPAGAAGLDADPDLPGRESPAMRRLRDEHPRMLGNGRCTRPAELDCAFETTCCEGCGFFQTTIAFRPTLQANATTPKATTSSSAQPFSTN